MKEFTLQASVEKLDAVLAFVDEALEAADCPMKTQMQIDLAVEEIFVNVASYAYAPGTGEVTVSAAPTEDHGGITLVFADRGVPYDPLAKRDPNLSLSADERPIGGLGVFLTKKLMDELRYEFRDGQNILTMKKNWRSASC